MRVIAIGLRLLLELQLQPQAVAELTPVSRLRRPRGGPQRRQLAGKSTYARRLFRCAQRQEHTIVFEVRTLMRLCTARRPPAAVQQRAGPTCRILDRGRLVVALQVRKPLDGRELARVARPALRQRRQRLVLRIPSQVQSSISLAPQYQREWLGQ